MVRMATELVLLGTADAPLPVPGRAGISSALVVDGRVFVIDCGRGTPSGLADAALDRMAGLHTDVTQVGGVAERAGVGELILSHYLPAEPGAVSEQEWVKRAGLGFSGRTTAGRDGLRRTLSGAEER